MFVWGRKGLRSPVFEKWRKKELAQSQTKLQNWFPVPVTGQGWGSDATRYISHSPSQKLLRTQRPDPAKPLC